MKVTASAPGKLMLMGEHAVVYGQPCIVTAVDQRMRVTVGPNGEGEIHVESPNIGLDEYHKSIERLGQDEVPKSMVFVEELVKLFYEEYHLKEGIRISTECSFSEKFGFGSSAAVVVALTRALAGYFGKEMTKKEIFELAFRAVLEVQGVGSGFDVAASVYGGTIYYITPGNEIHSAYKGELPMVVGYTGVKADTPTLVRQVAELKRNEVWVDDVFRHIGELVDQAEVALQNKKFEQLGKLVNVNQKLLTSLNVNSAMLEKLIAAAKKAGAWGAKLSGAGGGDCMIAIVSKESERAVGAAIEAAGGTWIKVKTGAEGVRVEK